MAEISTVNECTVIKNTTTTKSIIHVETSAVMKDSLNMQVINRYWAHKTIIQDIIPSAYYRQSRDKSFRFHYHLYVCTIASGDGNWLLIAQ